GLLGLMLGVVGGVGGARLLSNNPSSEKKAAEAPPKLATVALLRVAYTPPRVFGRDSEKGCPQEFALFRRTQGELIRSRKVILAALKQKRISRLKAVTRRRDAVEWLESKLVVEHTEGSQLIRVGLADDGDDPGDLARIVNAVVNAYLEE